MTLLLSTPYAVWLANRIAELHRQNGLTPAERRRERHRRYNWSDKGRARYWRYDMGLDGKARRWRFEHSEGRRAYRALVRRFGRTPRDIRSLVGAPPGAVLYTQAPREVSDPRRVLIDRCGRPVAVSW